MSDLPSGWVDTPLEMLVREGPTNGYSPQSGSQPDGTPTLKLSATTSGVMLLNDATTKRTMELVPHDSKFWLQPGDLLLQRANSLEYVGTAALYEGPPNAYIYPDLMMRLRAREEAVDAQYLCRALNDLRARGYFKERATGTAGNMPKINGTAVRSAPVRLPPLNEQRRIVAKLESLQARSRRAREALASVGQREHQLVRAWVRPTFPRAALGQHVIQKTVEVGDNWQSYALVGLSNEGRITERRERIGKKTAHKCRVVQPGDIVFNPIRFSIGSVARYRGPVPVIVSPEYEVMVTRPTLSGELLVRYLRSPLGRSTLETETTGSVRYRVYFKDLALLDVPIAPVSEQAKAERLLGHIAALTDRLHSMARTLDDLNAAMLAKAFRGELVPQDPADEPADVMLARLRGGDASPSPVEATPSIKKAKPGKPRRMTPAAE